MGAAGFGTLLLLLLRAAPCPGQLAGDTGERPRGMAASGGRGNGRGVGMAAGSAPVGVRGGGAALRAPQGNLPNPGPAEEFLPLLSTDGEDGTVYVGLFNFGKV